MSKLRGDTLARLCLSQLGNASAPPPPEELGGGCWGEVGLAFLQPRDGQAAENEWMAPSIFLPKNTPITFPLWQWKYQWSAYPILDSQTDQMC